MEVHGVVIGGLISRVTVLITHIKGLITLMNLQVGLRV